MGNDKNANIFITKTQFNGWAFTLFVWVFFSLGRFCGQYDSNNSCTWRIFDAALLTADVYRFPICKRLTSLDIYEVIRADLVLILLVDQLKFLTQESRNKYIKMILSFFFFFFFSNASSGKIERNLLTISWIVSLIRIPVENNINPV